MGIRCVAPHERVQQAWPSSETSHPWPHPAFWPLIMKETKAGVIPLWSEFELGPLSVGTAENKVVLSLIYPEYFCFHVSDMIALKLSVVFALSEVRRRLAQLTCRSSATYHILRWLTLTRFWSLLYSRLEVTTCYCTRCFVSYSRRNGIKMC